MKSRNLIILLTSIIVLLFSGWSFANSREVIEIAGTIRNTGSGWNTLNNSAHESIGITSVETHNNKIVINHKLAAKKVITFIVTPDETMSSEGYRVGISGGLDYSYIYIYDNDNNLVNPNDYYKGGSNIWIYGKLSK